MKVEVPDGEFILKELIFSGPNQNYDTAAAELRKKGFELERVGFYQTTPQLISSKIL